MTGYSHRNIAIDQCGQGLVIGPTVVVGPYYCNITKCGLSSDPVDLCSVDSWCDS